MRPKEPQPTHQWGSILEQIRHVEKKIGNKILDDYTTNEDIVIRYGKGAQIYRKTKKPKEKRPAGIPYPIAIPQPRHETHGLGWGHSQLPQPKKTHKKDVSCREPGF